MASGGKNTAGTEVNRLTCSVCLEPFRQPRLLPCFHTFCTPCLQELADSVVTGATDKESTCKGKEQDSSGTDQNSETVDMKSSSFLCPTCRKPVTVPPGGVKEFQSNFYLEADMSDQKPSAPACDMCDEDNTAAYVCNECQQNLCQTCRGFHDRVAVTKSHQVTSLAKGRGKQTRSTKSAHASRGDFCRTHGDQKLLFYCHQCQAAICLYCKLTSHEGHMTEDMAVAAERIRAEVHKLSLDLKMKMEVADRVIVQVSKEQQELEQQRQAVMSEAQASVEKISVWVKQAQDKLADQVGEIAYPIHKKLQSQLEQAVGTKTTLTDLQDRTKAVLERGTHADLVVLKAEIEECTMTRADFVYEPGKDGEEITLFSRFEADGKKVTQTTVSQFLGEMKPDTDGGLSTKMAEPGRSATDTIVSVEGVDEIGSVLCLDFMKDNCIVVATNKIVHIGPGTYDYEKHGYLTVLDVAGNIVVSSDIHQHGGVVSLACLSPQVILMSNNKGMLKMTSSDLCSPQAMQISLSEPVLLSHNKPDGKCFCIGKVSPRVFEIQEISLDLSGKVTCLSLFRMLYHGAGDEYGHTSSCLPTSFDVSADGTCFAVLSHFREFSCIDLYHCGESHPYVSYHDTCYYVQDICFSDFGGKEMLRVAASGKNNTNGSLYVLDHCNSCRKVYSMTLQSPTSFAWDGKGKLGIACDRSDKAEIIVSS